MMTPAPYLYPKAHLAIAPDPIADAVADRARPEAGSWGLTRAAPALVATIGLFAAWSAAAALLA